MGNLCGTLGSSMPRDRPDSEHLTIYPNEAHHATVIWLHGLGDSGHSWHKRVLDARPLPGVKFMFPTAPFRSVTIHGGMKMPAWFDIYGIRPEDAEDEVGIDKASQLLARLVAAEMASGIPPHQIVLVGFSQGGALAAHTCYRVLDQVLGGLILLGSYVPLASTFSIRVGSKTPALLCHGDRDLLVPLQYAKGSNEILLKHGVATDLKIYKGLGHCVSDAELVDVFYFLQTRLGCPKPAR
ncbi:acyl-protein thioesterase [Aphanomyces cochlioides]|nr:acyl-protein thioesterase [Aphanomyces cochlioides]KAG9412172.1 acyl-protein thioesterase [Aphanomyces cochlioides]